MRLAKKQILLTAEAVGNILGDELGKLVGLSKKHQKPIIAAGIQAAERDAQRLTGSAKTRAYMRLDAWRTLLHDL